MIIDQMTTAEPAFSRLDNLLLFQAIKIYGTQHDAFNKISASLQHTFHSDSSTPAAARPLNPAILERHYRYVLEDQVRRKSQSIVSSHRAISSSPGTAPSQQALPDDGLIEEVAEDLYASYKNQITHEIREDERRYDELQRELKQLATAPYSTSNQAGGDVDVLDAPTADASSTPSQNKPAQVYNNGLLANLDRDHDVPRPSVPLRPSDSDAFEQVADHNSTTLTYPNIRPQASIHHLGSDSQTSDTFQSQLILDYRQAEPSARQTGMSQGPSEELRQGLADTLPSHSLTKPAHATTRPPQLSVAVPSNQIPSQMPLSQRPERPTIKPAPPPPKGGVMLPPFQVTPQPPAGATQTGGRTRGTSTGPPTQRKSLPDMRTSDEDDRPRSMDATPTPSDMHHRITLAAPELYSTERRPTFAMSPGSTTGWHHQDFPIEMEDVDRPRPGSISPISERAPSPSLKSQEKPVPTKKKPGRPPKSAGVMHRSANSVPIIASARLGRRGRSGSAVSPTYDAADQVRAALVKGEPSTPASSSLGLSGRSSATAIQRRSAGVMKRKRDGNDQDDLRILAQDSVADQPSAGITSYRNFARMTQPIMNNIQSHKHGSMFSVPVRDRDAEGYKDIIRRPQDLKSIRAAVSTGSRLVAASTQAITDGDVGSPGAAGGNIVILPNSDDFMPPKAIVNGAQLEQEIMRMLANAVLFNPGEEGVVRDTREMFETVEELVDSWRAAERATGDGKTARSSAKIEDEVEDEDLGSESVPAKRRRL